MRKLALRRRHARRALRSCLDCCQAPSGGAQAAGCCGPPWTRRWRRSPRGVPKTRRRPYLKTRPGSGVPTEILADTAGVALPLTTSCWRWNPASETFAPILAQIFLNPRLSAPHARRPGHLEKRRGPPDRLIAAMRRSSPVLRDRRPPSASRRAAQPLPSAQSRARCAHSP